MVQWKVISDLSSDHNPILIDIALVCPTSKVFTRIFLTFWKANWDGFTTHTENSIPFFSLIFHKLLDATVGMFNVVILAASKRHIKAGFVRLYVLLYSEEVKLLMQQ